MAQKHSVTVENVAESGPGLAFIAYPQATAMMPLPHFWTVCLLPDAYFPECRHTHKIVY
ncbi:hypothetical protein LDENG_00072570 [Lucifuga dentata]|nr:hypothetical protein LDENG_00072570 [Lucifuga dentata]